MSDVVDLREDVKITIRALLKSFPTPMTLEMLERDYLTQVGRKIPFMKLGFTSLLEFLRSLPEAVNVEFCDESIILKASNTEYEAVMPKNLKKHSNSNVQAANFFVSHHIQHSFSKFIKDHKTGILLSDVENFWKEVQTLEEYGIQSSAKEFIQSYLSHLAYLRENRIYPFNLRNIHIKDSGILVPELKHAAHIDDRTKNFIRNVLAKFPSGIHYCKFPEVYKQETGVYFECTFWGYHSVLEMALHIPELFRCIQTGSSDWTLLDARQFVSREVPEQPVNFITNTLRKSNTSKVSQNSLVNGHNDERKICSCAKKPEMILRLYGSAGFLKTLKSSELSTDTPCNIFHMIPQLCIPDHIAPGTTVPIHISEVVSPDRFYFVLKKADGKEVLDHLLTVMYEFYSMSRRQFQLNKDDVVEGLFCVVLYVGRCLRAQVHEVVNKETVLVRFVDYGVVVSADVDNLYYFHPAFGFFPQQALVGRLAHLHPASVQLGWSQEANLFLYNTLVNSLVTAVVTFIDAEEQVVMAEIVAETNDHEYVYVNQTMVDLGFAVRDV